MKAVTFYAVLAIFVLVVAGCDNPTSTGIKGNNKWTVTFDKNNNDPGSTEANPTTKSVSSPETTIGSLPEPPTRPGYTFTVWRTGTAGGSVFTANTFVSGNITVYAQWVAIPYAVIFDANGATSGTAPAGVTAEYNIPITIPDGSGLSKPGYYFDGWNTQKDGEGDKYAADDSYTVTGNVRLYVHWESIPYDPLRDLLAEVFDEMHIQNPIFGRMYVHGNTHDVVPIRGSVTKHLFEDSVAAIDTSKMMPLANTARPGIVRENTKYIIYHDTANTNATANALTHANLQYNNNSPSASWHYTVDYQSIYQSIPHNERAWHAGNSEGNYNSIGIETCVNWGTSQTVYMSDFFQTWQRMGQLVAWLLSQYPHLTMADVLSHKEISVIGYDLGQATYHKCCPSTLRHAVLYEMAKDLIRCEYLYLTKIKNEEYTAEIIVDPDAEEYIDAKGRIKKLPAVPTTVYYTIRLTAPDGESREKIYSSLLSSQSKDYAGRCDIVVGTCSYNSLYTTIPAAASLSIRLSSSVPSWQSFSRHIHDDTTVCNIAWGEGVTW